MLKASAKSFHGNTALIKTIVIVAVAIMICSCSKPENDPAKRSELEKVQRQAAAAMSAKQYTHAELLIRRAHELWVSMYGNDESALSGITHGVTRSNIVGRLPAPTYDELARSLEGQGKYELAEPIRRKVLAVHERNQPSKGQLETSVWESMDKLAANLAAQKKFEESIALYSKSIAIKTAPLKPEEFSSRPGSYEAAKTRVSAQELAQIAEIYRRQRRFKEAEKLFNQAINADLGSLSPPGMKNEWMSNYARLLRETGRTIQAKSVEEQIDINDQFRKP